MIKRLFSLPMRLFIFIYVVTYTASAQDAEILEAVEQNMQAQLEFLQETVNQNSGSLNIKGVRGVGKIYARELKKDAFETRWIDMPSAMARAGHLVATRDFGPGPHLLLIGHLDTVFEPESPFQRFQRDGDIVKGPGVVDMKGGNAVIVYALRALIETDNISHGKVTVFLTGDEETVGRPLEVARRDLIEAGKAADVALNFESGRPKWAVVGRRGSSGWTIDVKAKRAHSSGIFRDSVGAGAGFELARILNRFYAEVRGPTGLTFNPGVMAAGSTINTAASSSERIVSGKSNVVAEYAYASGGLRFMSDTQLKEARALMRDIVEDSLPHTQASIRFRDAYPAMEITKANLALLDQLNAVHARLGIEAAKPSPPERRGASDISFVAPYVTSMDGLGVSGSGSHSERETMELESLGVATRRAALFIHDILRASNDTPGIKP